MPCHTVPRSIFCNRETLRGFRAPIILKIDGTAFNAEHSGVTIMTEHPVFRASEILDMAVQIERQGLEFYETCLAHASHPLVLKALQFMAEEERRHVEIFEHMKRGLEQYDPPESYPGELQAYLESFVKDRVFARPEEALEQARSLVDVDQAIDLAIGFEKRSILFYSAMKQVVRPSEREQTERVIAEEHAHIRRLLALRRDLAQDSADGDQGRT